jgi:predicted RNA-binding Zn-ribbon protein involved in translation (DUF1610 family)
MNPAEVQATQSGVAEDVVETDAAEIAEITQGEGDLHQYCPSCISAKVHRSHARNVVERLRRGMTLERLFRCDSCGWRGWLMPLVSVEGDVTDGAHTPDLTDLDKVVQPAAPRRAFSPRNLE